MTNTTCTFCGKAIYKRPSHMRLYKKHFCNGSCQKEYEKQTNTKIEVYCGQCGESLTRSRQQLRKSVSGNHFCNNLCKNRFLISKRWEGKEQVEDRKTRRNKVIKTFNGFCVNCGYNKDTRMLDAHHVDGNHQNNDFSNLWSICVWCHQLHHRCHTKVEKIYGV